ncbi:disks large-associated protein 3-like [Limulus polyphemus]|uniref:Disks large-associated protein 3-like n=1 Tax=Limulus polyphemus TaxID=6850 RepID=A0ABM1TQE8_LIMPO|nr:disks large-associated protein 3-like [Limulus polyphemus]XP_022258104.1 disks large-associated protein 3-like [Limulus polyphemus]
MHRNNVVLYETLLSSSETYIVQNSISTQASFKSAGDIVIKIGETSSSSASSVNGHLSSRSLVRQRLETIDKNIASQEREENREKGEFRRTSKKEKRNDAWTNPRSLSILPRTVTAQSKSLPVFRYLTKDFKEQLATMDRSLLPPSVAIIPVHSSPKAQKKYISQDVHISDGDLSVTECVCPQPGTNLQGEHIDSQRSTVPKHNGHVEGLTLEQEKIDGEWFLVNMEKIKEQILSCITEAEKQLKGDGVPEEGAGKIRVAVGKANLLLSQKFEQFRELCEKNLNQDVSEPFPTKDSDLSGFWDMMMLQVDDVLDTFTNLKKLCANNWVEVELPKVATPKSCSRRPVYLGVSKSTPASPQRSARAITATQAREEARKRLLEAKRKGRQQQASQEPATEIAIFVPDGQN